MVGERGGKYLAVRMRMVGGVARHGIPDDQTRLVFLTLCIAKALWCAVLQSLLLLRSHWYACDYFSMKCIGSSGEWNPGYATDVVVNYSSIV